MKLSSKVAAGAVVAVSAAGLAGGVMAQSHSDGVSADKNARIAIEAHCKKLWRDAHQQAQSMGDNTPAGSSTTEQLAVSLYNLAAVSEWGKKHKYVCKEVK
jgi:hypothetical protein